MLVVVRHILAVLNLKSFGMDSVQLGKQYLVKKFTLPWESNPGPTPIRGGLATIQASVGLKKLLAIHHKIQVR